MTDDRKMQYHLESDRLLSFNPVPSASSSSSSSTQQPGTFAKSRSRILSKSSAKSTTSIDLVQSSWPLSTSTHPALTPANLARAGYYYHPDSFSPAASGDTTLDDQCRCFLCGKTLAGWDETDDPFEEHWRRGAASLEADQAGAEGGGSKGKKEAEICPWAMAVCSVILEKRNRVEDGKGGSKAKGKVAKGSNGWILPNPSLLPTSQAMCAARLATFGKANAWWPHPIAKRSGWLTTPMSLSKAGFTFTPNSDSADCATCYYCDMSLDGWECVDEPWEHHERRAPDCPFFLARFERGSGDTLTEAEGVNEVSKPTVKRATKPLKLASTNRRPAANSTKSVVPGRSRKTRGQAGPSGGEMERDSEAEGVPTGGRDTNPESREEAEESASDLLASTSTAATSLNSASSASLRSADHGVAQEEYPPPTRSPVKRGTRSRKATGVSVAATKGGKGKLRSVASKASSIAEWEPEELEETIVVAPIASGDLGGDEGNAEQPTEGPEEPRVRTALPVYQEQGAPTAKRPTRAGRKTAQTVLDVPGPIITRDPAVDPPPLDTGIGLGQPPVQQRVPRKASAAIGTSSSMASTTGLRPRTASATSLVSTSSSTQSQATAPRRADADSVKSVTDCILAKGPPASKVTKARTRGNTSVAPSEASVSAKLPVAQPSSSAAPVRVPPTRRKKASTVSGTATGSTSAPSDSEIRLVGPSEGQVAMEGPQMVVPEQEEEVRIIRENSTRLGAKEAREVMENLDTLTPRAGKVSSRPLEENLGLANSRPSSDGTNVGAGIHDDQADMTVLDYIRSVYQQRYAELKADGERMVTEWEDRVKLERSRIEAIPTKARVG